MAFPTEEEQQRLLSWIAELEQQYPNVRVFQLAWANCPDIELLVHLAGMFAGGFDRTGHAAPLVDGQCVIDMLYGTDADDAANAFREFYEELSRLWRAMQTADPEEPPDALMPTVRGDRGTFLHATLMLEVLPEMLKNLAQSWEEALAPHLKIEYEGPTVESGTARLGEEGYIAFPGEIWVLYDGSLEVEEWRQILDAVCRGDIELLSTQTPFFSFVKDYLDTYFRMEANIRQAAEAESKSAAAKRFICDEIRKRKAEWAALTDRPYPSNVDDLQALAAEMGMNFDRAIDGDWTLAQIWPAVLGRLRADRTAAGSEPQSREDESYLSHGNAVAMLRLSQEKDRTSKQVSKLMEGLRKQFGETLRCRKAGNRWSYHAGDWERVVKLIRSLSGANGDDDEGGIDAIEDLNPQTLQQRVEAMKEESLARKRGNG